MKSILVTDIKTRQTFVLEIWRRGSRKIHSTVMPAVGREADKRIEFRRVPLYIRQAGRAALCP